MFPNISSGKGNQKMKFGQLIEDNRGTFSPKNDTQNVVDKLFPNPFLKNQNLISRSIVYSFTHFIFIICQVEGY